MKQLKTFLFMKLFTLNLIGCGDSTQYITKNLPPEPFPPELSTEEEDILKLVQWRNEERKLLGQAPITLGLACTVSTILNDKRCLSSTSPGCSVSEIVLLGAPSFSFLYLENFVESENSALDILPKQIQGMFDDTNFRIICTGSLVISESGFYEFELSSDDASILTVNNVQVVNNDGESGYRTNKGSIPLMRGIVNISVNYAQTSGIENGLSLKMNDENIFVNRLYH